MLAGCAATRRRCLRRRRAQRCLAHRLRVARRRLGAVGHADLAEDALHMVLTVKGLMSSAAAISRFVLPLQIDSSTSSSRTLKSSTLAPSRVPVDAAAREKAGTLRNAASICANSGSRLVSNRWILPPSETRLRRARQKGCRSRTACRARRAQRRSASGAAPYGSGSGNTAAARYPPARSTGLRPASIQRAYA